MFKSDTFRAIRHIYRPVLPKVKASTIQRRMIMEALPYSGPPSYETLRKRFMASAPNPESFKSRKREAEARDRGECVDIHDVTGIQPSEYDVLVSDIQHETLETTIAQDLGISYLSKAEEADANYVVESITGYIRRSGHRALVPMVVNYKGEARWVLFIIDSSSPFTYLSVHVSSHSCIVIVLDERTLQLILIPGLQDSRD